MIYKFQEGGAIKELEPSVVTDSPQTHRGRIKLLRNQLREARRNYRNFDRKLKQYDYIPNQETLDNFTSDLDGLYNIKSIRNDIRAERDLKRSNGFLGFSSNSIPSQLYRWYSRHMGYQHKLNNQISGKGTDIIDLDNNVIRLTPISNQSTALFNEYVESTKPSVHLASQYQSGRIKNFGDRYNIPVDNINLYAGIENGHYKVDSLKNFNPNTVIYPARNIKSNLLPITEINVSLNEARKNQFNPRLNKRLYNLSSKTPSNQATVIDLALSNPESNPELNENIRSEIRSRYDLAKEAYKEGNYNKALTIMDANIGLEPSRRFTRRVLRQFKNPFKRVGKRTYIKDWPEFIASDVYGKMHEDKSIRELNGTNLNRWTDPNYNEMYQYTDILGNKHPISEYNAKILDNKMVFGNPTGGKFIGRFQDISQPQLDSLNNWLRNNPSWLVTPDLGSFSQYRLDSPTLQEYLKQYYEHPRAEDPNVYTIGTTEPNKIW